MNKIMFSIILLGLVFALVACGGANTNDTTVSDGTSSGNTTGELSLPTQLLIGSLKLEGTDLAVDAQQASELLPLWQAYNELTTSETAAQAEIDAVVTQIQETMTPQQLQAITDMKLTPQEEFSLMQELGLVTNRTNASGTPQAPFGQGFVPGAGERPGEGQGGYPGGGAGGYTGGGPSGGAGGYPGAGGVPGGSQGFDPQQMATALAGRGQSSGTSERIPTPLLNALIALLQKRAQP
jgi:hypothetical protein